MASLLCTCIPLTSFLLLYQRGREGKSPPKCINFLLSFQPSSILLCIILVSLQSDHMLRIMIYSGIKFRKTFKWMFIRNCHCQRCTFWHQSVERIKKLIILFGYWNAEAHVSIFCPVYKGIHFSHPSYLILLCFLWILKLEHYVYFTSLIYLHPQKHSLFRQVFVIYSSMSNAAKQVWLSRRNDFVIDSTYFLFAISMIWKSYFLTGSSSPNPDSSSHYRLIISDSWNYLWSTFWKQKPSDAGWQLFLFKFAITQNL